MKLKLVPNPEHASGAILVYQGYIGLTSTNTAYALIHIATRILLLREPYALIGISCEAEWDDWREMPGPKLEITGGER